MVHLQHPVSLAVRPGRGRERGREGVRERGREEGKEGGREGGRERREGGREGGRMMQCTVSSLDLCCNYAYSSNTMCARTHTHAHTHAHARSHARTHTHTHAHTHTPHSLGIKAHLHTLVQPFRQLKEKLKL